MFSIRPCRSLRAGALFIVCFLASINTPTSAQEIQFPEIQKAPIPDWVHIVEAVDKSEDNRDLISNGKYYHLSDRQYRHMQGGYEFFSRYVYEVTDRSGLEEAARITLSFDPSQTRLSFSRMTLRRGEDRFNLRDQVEITVLRQEEQVDDGILDGDLTALVVLEDVRVGDVIEYAFHGETKNALWPDHFFGEISLGWGVPIGRAHYRLSWPKNKPIYTQSYNDAPTLRIEENDDLKVYSVIVDSPKPVQNETGTPDWYIERAHISLSTMNSWKNVHDWAVPFYDDGGELPDAFTKKIDEIKKKWPQKEDRLTEALRLVQNEIRYHGVEIGLGSHIPRQHADVIKKGYGDCKDKSWLLSKVLNELEISAWPALTDINSGFGLPEYLPAPTNFDHMIVKAIVDGHTYWLDPTDSYQGGRGQKIAKPEYGYALTIGVNNPALEKITLNAPEEPTHFAEEIYEFMDEADEQDRFLILKTTDVFLANKADQQRYELAEQSLESMNQGYLEYYQNSLKGLQATGALKITDDLDNNKIVIKGEYFLSREQAETHKTADGFTANAYTLVDQFYLPKSSSRETPIWLPMQTNRQHKFVFIVPGGRPSGIENMEATAKGMKFSRKVEAGGERLEVDLSLVSHIRQASAADYSEVNAFAETVSNENAITFTLNEVPESLAKRFKLDYKDYAIHETDIISAITHIQKKEFIESLQLINSIMDKGVQTERLRGFLMIFKAQTLSHLKRYKSSRDAYITALKLFPDDADSYFKLVDLHAHLKNYIDAIKTLTDFSYRYPEHVQNLRLEFLSGLKIAAGTTTEGRTAFSKLSLALSEANYTGDDNSGAETIHKTAFEYAIAQGEENKARKALEQISDADTYLELLTDRRYETLWPALEEKAGPKLKTIIEANIKTRKVKFLEDPLDFKNANDYALILWRAGKTEEALTVIEPLTRDWERMKAIASDAFASQTIYAAILHSLNRQEEAINAYKNIVELDADDFPDSLNMKVAYPGHLLEYGRFGEAIAAVDAINERDINIVGKMSIWNAKYCALMETGASQEAEALFAKIEENKSEHIRAFIESVLCRNDLNYAEEQLIAAIKNERDRTKTLRFFVKGLPSAYSTTFRKKIDQALSHLKTRPKIIETLQHYGRVYEIDAPENLW